MPRLLGGPEAAPETEDAAPMQPTAPPARPGEAALIAPLQLPAPWRGPGGGGSQAGTAGSGRSLGQSPSGGASGEDGNLGAVESGVGGVGGGRGLAGTEGRGGSSTLDSATALAAAAAAKAGGRLHLARFYTQRARLALWPDAQGARSVQS